MTALCLVLTACGGGGGGSGSLSDDDNDRSVVTDTDGDGVADSADNCPSAANADQADADSDGIGDVCDTALALTIDPPDSFVVGDTATFDVSVDNGVGTLSYELVGAPTGMIVDTDGVVSWTPGGIQFGAAQSYTFSIKVTDDNGSVSQEVTVSVAANANYQPLVRSSAKVPTKSKSIKAGDFDGDGLLEVLTTDNKGLLFTLEFNGADYAQNWVYPFAFSGNDYIDAIDVGDIDGDGTPDFVVLHGVKVTVIDGASRVVLYTAELTGADGLAVQVADVDVDGVNEIVVMLDVDGTNRKIEVLSKPSSGTELTSEWSTEAGSYGNDMVVAQFDSDDALEIVTAQAAAFDGVSQEDQWQGSTRPVMGDIIKAAQVSGGSDGIMEVVALITGEGGPFMNIYSIDKSTDLLGKNNIGGEPEVSMCDFAVGDVDGTDDYDEIVIGFCSAGEDEPAATEHAEFWISYDVENVNGVVGALKSDDVFERTNSGAFDEERLSGGFRGMTLIDLDNNGVFESLVWANAFSGSDKEFYDAYSVMSSTGGAVTSYFERGLPEGFFLGAVNAEISIGTERAIFSSYAIPAEGDPDENDYGEFLLGINYSTGEVEVYNSHVNYGLSGEQRPAYDVEAGDVLGNGYDQIVASVNDIPGDDDLSRFEVLDLATPLNSIADAGILSAHINGDVEIGLITSDTTPDIIGLIGSQLMSFEPSDSMNQLWNSAAEFSNSVELKLVSLDIDNTAPLTDDLELELLVLRKTILEFRNRIDDALTGGDGFNGNIFQRINAVSGTNFTAVETGDFDSDGDNEVVAADNVSDGSTTVTILSNQAAQLATIAVSGNVTDLLFDPTTKQLLVAWNTTVEGSAEQITPSYITAYYATASDLSSWEVSWTSPALLGAVQHNALHFGPSGQLLIGTEHAMYITR